MSAGRYDFKIEQGSYFERVVTWQPGGQAADLTGYTARMKLKDAETGSTLVSLSGTPTLNGDRLVIGASAGTVTIFISGKTTAALSFDVARYDLELVRPSDSEPKRILEGRVSFDPEATD